MKVTRKKERVRIAEACRVSWMWLKSYEVLRIKTPTALARCVKFKLYNRLCDLTNTRHDPCVIDVFLTAVGRAKAGGTLGKGAEPWWRFTAAREVKLAHRRELILST